MKNDTAGKKNPGDNVYTTLDVHIQQVANDQLDIYRGAIIVTEVSTGKILAMVSHPDFDPNTIPEIWDDLIDNDSSTVLLNRATQGLYPPGSTFKIVTAFGIYPGRIPPRIRIILITVMVLSGWETAKSVVITVPVTDRSAFRSPLQKSCNSSFANIGMSLDREAFQETLNDLFVQ